MSERFAIVPKEARRRRQELTPNAYALYIELCAYRNRETGQCTPSKAEQMEAVGLSQTRWYEARACLIEKRWARFPAADGGQIDLLTGFDLPVSRETGNQALTKTHTAIPGKRENNHLKTTPSYFPENGNSITYPANEDEEGVPLPAFRESGNQALSEIPGFRETGNQALTEIPVSGIPGFRETGIDALIEIPAFRKPGNSRFPETGNAYRKNRELLPEQRTDVVVCARATVVPSSEQATAAQDHGHALTAAHHERASELGYEFTPLEDALRQAKKWPLLLGEREIAELRLVAAVLAEYRDGDAATPERCQRVGEYYREVMRERGKRSWKLSFILRDWGDFLAWLQDKGYETTEPLAKNHQVRSKSAPRACPVCQVQAVFYLDPQDANHGYCEREGQFYRADSRGVWLAQFEET